MGIVQNGQAKAYIRSIGAYVPSRRVSNDDLAKIVPIDLVDRILAALKEHGA